MPVRSVNKEPKNINVARIKKGKEIQILWGISQGRPQPFETKCGEKQHIQNMADIT